MKKYSIFILLFLYLICSANSCSKENGQGHADKRLNIINNTEHIIASFIQYNYPDTSIQDKETPGFNSISIEPHSKNVHLTFVSWETLINQNNQYGIISILIFSSDTIQTYSWEEIQKNYNVLKRYDLSLQDLERMNWTITYP